MAYLWSNPTPDNNQNASVLGAQANILGPSIGPLLAAILANKSRKAQQEQQAMQQLGSSVSGAVGNYMGQQDAGRLAQFEQSGMTDQSDAAINPVQQQLLSQMRPQAQLQATNWVEHQLHDQELEDIKRQLSEARSNEYNARANGLWNNGGLTPGQSAVQERFEERQRLKEIENQIKSAKSEYSSYGYPTEILDSTTAVHQGVDATGQPVPEGQYRLDIPAKGNTAASTKDVPSSAFDTAHQALNHYRELLSQKESALSTPSASQGGYAKGTRVKQNGIVYEFDGANWNPVQ